MGDILHVRKTPRGGVRTRIDVALWGTWAMVQRNRDVYLKTWKTNFIPPLLEPLLYLLSLGFGVGAFVHEIPVPGYGMVPYPRFITPAILAITMMQGAFFETTYNSFVRMYFQKTWDAVTATPLSLDDVLAGEMLWAALKSTINATLMAVVIAVFGSLPGQSILLPWSMIPFVMVVAFLAGLLFAGIGLFVSAMVRGIDGFSIAIYLFVTPMMLFSGTFFPLSQLPTYFQYVAQALPLTHTVLALRPFVMGDWIHSDLASLAYLTVGAVLLPYVALVRMRRKLII